MTLVGFDHQEREAHLSSLIPQGIPQLAKLPLIRIEDTRANLNYIMLILIVDPHQSFAEVGIFCPVGGVVRNFSHLCPICIQNVLRKSRKEEAIIKSLH